jgi:D-glycero-alpha-D-manno-heptose 1-phosphate guanylyltransferase
LAGGLGTRLSSVVPNCQKVVAPIEGKPFLERLLKKLQEDGISKIVLALGYRSEDVINSICKKNFNRLTLLTSIEPRPLGTGGAIKNSISFVETEDVIVVNGDSLIDFPIGKLIEFHRKNKSILSMLICHVEDAGRYGSVGINKKNQIISFHEKNNSNEPGYINAGVYIMSKVFISELPSCPHSLEKFILPNLCGRGFYGLKTNANFIDIGTPQDFKRAANVLK